VIEREKKKGKYYFSLKNRNIFLYSSLKMNLGTYANIFLIVLKNTKKKSASDIKVDKKENSSRKKEKIHFFFALHCKHGECLQCE
jgi:hypothetical protein